MREKLPQRLSELIAAGKINEVICQVGGEAERKKEKIIQHLLLYCKNSLQAKHAMGFLA